MTHKVIVFKMTLISLKQKSLTKLLLKSLYHTFMDWQIQHWTQKSRKAELGLSQEDKFEPRLGNIARLCFSLKIKRQARHVQKSRV